jgi:coatomer subunit beta'
VINVSQVFWSESGELVTLACEDDFYVLRYSREEYINGLNAGEVDEDGVEAAVELVATINETVRTGQWVGDCFIYTNSTNRLNYLVGDQTYTISHFDQPMYVLGYLPRDGRIYLADKDVNAVSFGLSLSMVEYQTVVLRGDMDMASELLKDVPQDQMNKVARFLEGQGYKEMALEVATDPEHRFELALALNDLETALQIAREANVEHKWKIVGDAALAGWNLALAQECFTNAKDVGSLLLLHTASSNREGLQSLAAQASESGLHNVAFSTLWSLGDIDGCIALLVQTNRIAEAVLLAQTYKPSRAAKLVVQWKESLEQSGKTKVARLIGVPPGAPDVASTDDDLFPEWEEYIQLEKEGGVPEPPSSESLIDVNGDEEPASAINGAPESETGEETETTEETTLDEVAAAEAE